MKKSDEYASWKNVTSYLILLSAKDGSKDNYSKCNRINDYRKRIPTDTWAVYNLQGLWYQQI